MEELGDIHLLVNNAGVAANEAALAEGLADILVAPIRRQNMFKPGMGAR